MPISEKRTTYAQTRPESVMGDLLWRRQYSSCHRPDGPYGVGSGVGWGVGSGVGCGVGSGVGAGVGCGVATGVAAGVGVAVGWTVGRGVGLGVTRGVALGAGGGVAVAVVGSAGFEDAGVAICGELESLGALVSPATSDVGSALGPSLVGVADARCEGSARVTLKTLPGIPPPIPGTARMASASMTTTPTIASPAVRTPGRRSWTSVAGAGNTGSVGAISAGATAARAMRAAVGAVSTAGWAPSGVASDAGRTTVPIEVAETRLVAHGGSAVARTACRGLAGESDPIRCATSDSDSPASSGASSPSAVVGSPRSRRSTYMPIERSTTVDRPAPASFE